MDNKTTDHNIPQSKIVAQQRVEQIQAFKAELQQLKDEDIFRLSEQQQQTLQDYHRQLLNKLNDSFDVDINVVDKQLSIGLKLASLFGTLALAAGIFFLFYQYWGLFTPLAQSLVLLLSPLLSLGFCWFCLQRDVSGYYAKIAGFLTLTCFVLNVSMLAEIHNLMPTPNAFLVWSLLALGLAYLTQSRLLLSFAILLFSSFLCAKMSSWFGIYWLHFVDQPENCFVPALLIFSCGQASQKHYENFAPVFRVCGALLFLLPVLVLSHWGAGSYLKWNPDVIEVIYQFLGFALCSLLIVLGIKRHWKDVVNTGTVMFTLFLYTRLFDWFWDWFPKYLFFILIGLISLLVLMVFRRVRQQTKSGRYSTSAASMADSSAGGKTQ